MFDRFIRLARARRALREQRLHEAVQLANDPLIRADRRAERVRESAVAGLLRVARARLGEGELVTAQVELRRLQQLAPSPEVEALLAEVDAGLSEQAGRAVLGRQRVADLRRAIEAGELLRAEDVLAGGALEGDVAGYAQRIEARRQEARQLLDEALRLADQQRLESALATFRQAIAIDRDLAAPARMATWNRLAAAAAKQLGEAVDSGDLAQALRHFGAAGNCAPELLEHEAFARATARLQQRLLRSLVDADGLGVAVQWARKARAAGLPDDSTVEPIMTALLALDSGLGGGGQAGAGHGIVGASSSEALQQLAAVGRSLGFARLVGHAEAALAALDGAQAGLAAAQASLADGRLEAARAQLVAFLEQSPLHEAARRDLALVDQGLADLDRRLAEARLLLRDGELRAASAAAVALVGSARIAAEAQQILNEARSRMALVDRGLDEVRVALHGRAAATSEGVRHCLKRLDELAKVQKDHESLDAVRAAVGAEIEALELLQQAGVAMRANDLVALAGVVDDLVSSRQRLLDVERIDARLCRLGDEIGQLGERAMVEGRLAAVSTGAELLRALGPVRADFVARADDWRRRAAERESQAVALLRQAEERLSERDLAEAESLFETAQRACAEGPAVMAFAERLRRLRRHAETLQQVATLADEKDFLGAQQKLASMGSVPPMLRTRVYDMKQDLARAQGLEGAFLLRVDEGGEHLVMRGETVGIGNVRQGRADLPVLANLASRHASIRRSMSFHGGMQDKVVAEDGEVRVRGAVVREHVLRPGDRVQLGPAFGFTYERPAARSLSCSLVLQSGFQVAGTDRVIVMKDRGRDGRILIGPGADVHVRVARATGEVEVFASSAGQMRVACAQGGTIDGAPFKGEHPVAAGQIVEAAGVTFLLLPWQPMP